MDGLWSGESSFLVQCDGNKIVVTEKLRAYTVKCVFFFYFACISQTICMRRKEEQEKKYYMGPQRRNYGDDRKRDLIAFIMDTSRKR